MNTIELICTVIGAVATVLAGVWFIVRKAQKTAVNDYKLEKMEADVTNLKADVKADISAIKAVLIKKFPNAAEIFSMKKAQEDLTNWGNSCSRRLTEKNSSMTTESSFSQKLTDGSQKRHLMWRKLQISLARHLPMKICSTTSKASCTTRRLSPFLTETEGAGVMTSRLATFAIY